VSIAQRQRLLTVIVNRLARNAMTRLGGGWTLAQLWPSRGERLLITPHDLRTADPSLATEIYAGRFVFGGKIVNCHGRSIFDLDPPSEDWEVALLGFGWLRHLRAAETMLTRANARVLIDDWLTSPLARRRAIARRPDVVARRAMSLLSQSSFVLGDADSKFQRRYLRGVSCDIRYLRRTLRSIPDGVQRLQAIIALCYGALCLGNQSRFLRDVSGRLSDELLRQILPDGGHISRNPAALIELLTDLLPLRQTFAARNLSPPGALLNAIDRMMPALRFFRHGDGNFALFNGMGATPLHLLATLLAYDDTHGTPMAHMPHVGYHRMDAGQTTLIIDAGLPPPPNLSREAHAGCLSFELSSGNSRIITNCGVPNTSRDNWRSYARDSAAHSTLVCSDTASCSFVENQAVRQLLGGSVVVSGPEQVESQREAVENATVLALSHDGYLSRFGMLHRRMLMLADDGLRLDGEDTLAPPQGRRAKRQYDFALRFHLHPLVKASPLTNATTVMLTLPNRDVWVFESPDCPLNLEESVFLAGNEGPRRTTQIVIRQDTREFPSIRWSLSRSQAPEPDDAEAEAPIDS